ncbi:MAG: tRNA (N(6)-L-threonylcarbamoyladenosine(37)-C(2))-methylthiotransferase MtaB, partial [Butyricicoccaceae bacterium]
FASVHVFPYSEREGTPAARMEQIPLPVRNHRADIARELAGELSQAFLQQFVGKTIPVLLERSRTEFQPAHSKWHFAVHLPPESGAQGSLCHVMLTGIRDGALIGEPIFS